MTRSHASTQTSSAQATPSLRPVASSRPDLKLSLDRIVDELVRNGVTLSQARREFERQFIVASIRSNDGNLCRSARHLGVHRNTLHNKVSDLGITEEDLGRRRRFARP